jgi:hypothetical protein
MQVYQTMTKSKLNVETVNLFINRAVLLITINKGLARLKLPCKYFFVSGNNFLSLLFTSKQLFKGFISNLATTVNQLTLIYFLKLKLRGLGYRFKKYCNYLYRFYFTKTNFIYLHLPIDILIKSRKRRIILIGSNYARLRMLYSAILCLKQPGPYNRRGFTFPRRLILLKIGKKVA